jgi:hypothetical protein
MKEETKEEKTEEVKSVSNPTIDAANAAAKRTEEAAAKLQVQLDRQEAIESQRILGGGIAAEEKVANDGKTKLAVYKRGIFRGFAGAGGVVVGVGLITDTSTGAANELAAADVNSENIVGRALETAADTESFLFELNPFTVNLA